MGAGVGAVLNEFGIGDKQKVVTETKVPEYVDRAQRSALERAERIADRPYEAYTDRRVARQNRNERAASELAREGSIVPRSMLDEAAQRIRGVESFDRADLDAYTNPYVESVLSPQLREANRQYERDRSALLNSKAGAWGGDRVAFQESELSRRYGELITDVTARAHSEAFNRATQLWASDQDRQLRAAQGLQSVGGDISRLNRDQIQDLMATGGVERLLEQAELDFDYQQFLENRDWSVTNLDPLLRAITAARGGTTTQNQSTPGGAWGQAIGAGAALAGMYFGGSDNYGVKPITSEQWAAAESTIPKVGDLDVGY